MSLDVYLFDCTEEQVFHARISHSLIAVANFAGLYKPCWHPEELQAVRACDLIPVLRAGLERLQAHAATYRIASPLKGGNYDDLVVFAKRYLEACEKYPEATIEVSR